MTESARALLFVSERNTCRSPMAAGLARKTLGEPLRVETAGISSGFGSIASEAVDVMRGHGVDLADYGGTHIRKVPLQEFTLVIAMTPSIGQVLSNEYHVGGDRLEVWDIEDPYGKGVEAYRTCAKEILSNLQRFLSKLGLLDASRSQ
jgi:arsenate reductase (thioredoxin)